MQKLIYSVFALLLMLIAIGFMLPSKHQVEVTIEVDAPPATLFALVNDFRRHGEWSPWADTDPNARILYSGNPRGAGSIMTWNGVALGSGSQTITDSQPYERIDIAMNPGEQGEARAWFTFTPGIGNTRVGWGFEADYGFNIVGRYFAAMLGGVVARDYRNGLENLKSLAESLPSADFGDIRVERLVVEAVDIAFLSFTTEPTTGAIAEALRRAYFEILVFIDEYDLMEAGAPLAIKRGYSGSNLMIDAAIPVRGLSEGGLPDGPLDKTRVRIGKTYAGPVIRVDHVGSYRTLGETHRKITAYLAATGIERNGAAWESYVSDPGNTLEKDLLTYVYYPIRVD